MTQQTERTVSSTGQAMTGGDWLDVHFEASRPEYEAQVKAVGIQSGWHVLDAACGPGSFLPWLAELVGPEGRLAALDLAPEHVKLVDDRVTSWKLSCPVEAQVGNVLELPYPDDAFDAVWFANTTQYLTDEELRAALAELRRVVRSGGLVAVKEFDATLFRVLPAPPGLSLRQRRMVATSGDVQGLGTFRAPELPGWLRRASFADVWRRTTLIERSAPLDSFAYRFWHDALKMNAARAADLDLPAADQEVWAQLRDPAGLERFLDDPDCALIEGNILTVGTVPADASQAA